MRHITRILTTIIITRLMAITIGRIRFIGHIVGEDGGMAIRAFVTTVFLFEIEMSLFRIVRQWPLMALSLFTWATAL